jgi:integrase
MLQCNTYNSNFAENNNLILANMNLFKSYKTAKEIAPSYLLEKETVDNHKTYSDIAHRVDIFLMWLESQGLQNTPIRKITQDNITEFFYYIGREKKFDKGTCEHFLWSIRQMFTHAKKLGELTEMPFGNVVLPRKKKDQGAEVIHPSHLKPLLLTIKERDPQLFLASMILYYCFIRPGKELRLLRIGDIDCDSGLITVRQENAKNKIKQNVTMPKQLIDICREYNIDKADKKLFIFGKYKRFGTVPISINMLRWRFNKYREELNLPLGYKFYSFKHTGASSLHRSGISMREVMDQLRHTHLSATEHYLKHHCGIVNDRIRDNFPSPI